MYLTKEPLHHNEKAKFILIKDEATNLLGMKIFKTVANMFTKEDAHVLIVNYACSKEDLLYGLNANKFGLKYFHGYGMYPATDWVNENLSIDTLEELFLPVEGVLCINSLTSLLIHNGADKVFKTFNKLLNNNSNLQIVALVCPDVHDPYENDVLDKLATTILQVGSAEDDKLRSTVCYTSGKVTCLLLEYKISADFQFTTLVDAKFQMKKKQVQQPDPTANLTFNLRMKDEEIEARSQLQLPYMKTSSDEAIVQSLLDNDLYDEEDPDDDLDF